MTRNQQRNLQVFMNSLHVKKQVQPIVYTVHEIEAAKKVLYRIQKATTRISIRSVRLVPEVVREI